MTDCIVYRCSRQVEMYLYLRADLAVDQLPELLLRTTGHLTRVMDLALTPERRLARADTATALARLDADGWYLQLPPADAVDPHLHFGD